MGKITIQDVATKLIVQNGLSKKEATRFANKMFDLIREALEEEKIVKVKGLGTFKIIDVDSRESVNVNTGERVLIEGHNKITFTPDVLMKELVNKPFSQFETIVLNDGVDFKDSSEDLDQEVSEANDYEGENDNMPLVDFVSDEKPVSGKEEIPVEDIPEWVIEPYVMPVSEKSVEQEKTIEPETTVEPKSLMESEPSVQPEPIVEPEHTAVSDTTVEPEPQTESETTKEDDSDIEEIIYDEEGQPAQRKWILWLLACILALVTGYLLGSYLPLQNFASSNPKIEESVKELPAVEPSQPEADPVKEIDVEDIPEKVESEPVTEPETPKQSDVPAETSSQKQPETQTPADVTPDKYEAMDPRVRTGAYRIVGTDHVEKVRDGDNLKRIAKRTLGQDMECYIEVYNNLNASSELKTGQEIKIPKLQWKKKKTVQN